MDFDYITICSLITLLLVISTVKFVLNWFKYKNSNYYKITNHSYLSILFNKGTNGEFKLYQNLKFFETMGCKFLFNLYIPRENSKTSEIDLIMFHQKGLFVFESKNYSGWIFGNESNKKWTQTLPTAYSESHKEHFYNPIMQNATHIRAIRKYIDGTIPVYSIIAFSDNCTLKNVTTKSNVIVTYYRNVQEKILTKLSKINNYSMPKDLMDKTYNTLLKFTNVDEYTKLQHLKNLK